MAKTKAAAAPKSVDELVLHALKLAATKPNAKWTSASAAALFNTKEANHEAAIAECVKPDAPLLNQIGKTGALTAAGFARVASVLMPDEVTALAKATAAGMAPAERVAFLEGTISRTPAAAAELTPLLEEAVAAKKLELESQAAAKAKQAAAAAANRAALERALELSKQDLQNELEAVRRQWEALGQKLSDLPAHRSPEAAPEPNPASRRSVNSGRSTEAAHPLKTAEETDFRRAECDRLAAAWRDAMDAGKAEGAECLVDAMWNIRGFRMIGEPGATAEFNGRYHESQQSVASGPVKIVRPGWLLKEEDGEHVALKAAVVKA